MTTRRLLKAAEAIRQVVGMAILAEMRDPRVRDVTITRVIVSPDMREAKVYVSVMGDTAKQNLCLHGLQSARGFLQAKLAERIETRYTPRLQFILDMGVKHSLEIARILHEVLPPKPSEQSGEAPPAPEYSPDQAVVDQAVVDQAVVDQAVVDQAVVDQAVVDQAVVDQAVAGEHAGAAHDDSDDELDDLDLDESDSENIDPEQGDSHGSGSHE